MYWNLLCWYNLCVWFLCNLGGGVLNLKCVLVYSACIEWPLICTLWCVGRCLTALWTGKVSRGALPMCWPAVSSWRQPSKTALRPTSRSCTIPSPNTTCRYCLAAYFATCKRTATCLWLWESMLMPVSIYHMISQAVLSLAVFNIASYNLLLSSSAHFIINSELCLTCLPVFWSIPLQILATSQGDFALMLLSTLKCICFFVFQSFAA